MNPVNLEQHIQQKAANLPWLSQCLEGQYKQFPYELSKTHAGSLSSNYDYIPTKQSTTQPDCANATHPTYLINIPTTDKITSIIKLMQKELFSTTPEASKQLVAKRVAIVLGLNRATSLDEAKNRQFLKKLSSHQAIQGIAYRCIGFFWEPAWAYSDSHTEETYTRQMCYRIFKALAPNRAKHLLATVENKDLIRQQVPYSAIRSRIKTSRYSQQFAKYFEDHAPQSHTYYGLMDDDTRALRDKTGLLSLIDAVIIKKSAPSAISCGYRVDEPNRPILKLAVKLDMAVRAAMNSIIPYSAYLPEPGSFFCIRRPPGSNFLSQLSFDGQGAKLETRRLTQNARNRNLFNNNVIFLPEGGPLTGTPERMKSIKNGNLTLSQLKNKSFLQSLRGVPQTHAHPKKWADNLYANINFTASQVTDATGPIMHLFGIYDPIAQMYNRSLRYNKRNFDAVLSSYNIPALQQTHQDIRNSAYQALASLNMPLSTIQAIERAAIESGKAIHATLQRATS